MIFQILQKLTIIVFYLKLWSLFKKILKSLLKQKVLHLVTLKNNSYVNCNGFGFLLNNLKNLDLHYHKYLIKILPLIILNIYSSKLKINLALFYQLSKCNEKNCKKWYELQLDLSHLCLKSYQCCITQLFDKIIVLQIDIPLTQIQFNEENCYLIFEFLESSNTNQLQRFICKHQIYRKMKQMQLNIVKFKEIKQYFEELHLEQSDEDSMDIKFICTECSDVQINNKKMLVYIQTYKRNGFQIIQNKRIQVFYKIQKLGRNLQFKFNEIYYETTKTNKIII
ncbi:unnamed protein product [Paramecium sonneborni]|uniref:Uncharacterized protein n=1 Tax=Paramecium sonneborni TaxID=65129 RepID=A0A8S1MUB7_9CILI|nr:unnamed protein product [Paramecium sonneborni]